MVEAVGVLVLAGLAIAGVLFWHRQRRADEVRQHVAALSSLVDQAVALGDVELLAGLVAPEARRIDHLQLLREATRPLDGLSAAPAAEPQPEIRLASSRPGGPLDLAEVDVRQVVSDVLYTGQFLRRRRFQQSADGTWRLGVARAAPSATYVDWRGQVLTTTVAAADGELGQRLHERLDADLTVFCRRATSARHWAPWNRCAFRLVSDGLAVSRPNGGGLAYLPGPPGSFLPVDATAEALLRRTIMAELVAEVLQRPRGVLDAAVLAVWLEEAETRALPVAVEGVRDWSALAAVIDSGSPSGRGTSAAARAAALQLARDVLDVAGRNQLPKLLLVPRDEAGAASWLTSALTHPRQADTVLDRWPGAPARFPADRALLANCNGRGLRGGMQLLLPGQRAPVSLEGLVCEAPAQWPLNAAWREADGALLAACVGPREPSFRAQWRAYGLRPNGALLPLDPPLDGAGGGSSAANPAPAVGGGSPGVTPWERWPEVAEGEPPPTRTTADGAWSAALADGQLRVWARDARDGAAPTWSAPLPGCRDVAWREGAVPEAR